MGGLYTEHQKLPYCQSCYNKNFKVKGYGYGMSNLDSFKQVSGVWIVCVCVCVCVFAVIICVMDMCVCVLCVANDILCVGRSHA